MKLIMEQWRKYLTEDAKRRQALARDLEDAGVEDKWVRSGGSKANMQKIISQGRNLKKAFAKNADRKFLDSLVTVHWGSTQTIINMLDGNISPKDELSAAAYLPGSEFQDGVGRFGRFGIVIKGHITLLANDMDQLYTGEGQKYRDAFPERTKMSGAGKGVQQTYNPKAYEEYKILVLDKEDWNPKRSFDNETANNEALVDNWSPVALIVPGAPAKEDSAQLELPLGADDTDPTTGIDFVAKFEKLAKKAGLDIPVMSSGEFPKRERYP